MLKRALVTLICLLGPCHAFRLANSPAGKAAASGCIVKGHPDGCAQAKCHYGTLPAMWRMGDDPGTAYQLLDETCKLRNLLSPHIQAALLDKHLQAVKEPDSEDDQDGDYADDEQDSTEEDNDNSDSSGDNDSSQDSSRDDSEQDSSDEGGREHSEQSEGSQLEVQAGSVAWWHATANSGDDASRLPPMLQQLKGFERLVEDAKAQHSVEDAKAQHSVEDAKAQHSEDAVDDFDYSSEGSREEKGEDSERDVEYGSQDSTQDDSSVPDAEEPSQEDEDVQEPTEEEGTVDEAAIDELLAENWDEEDEEAASENEQRHRRRSMRRALSEDLPAQQDVGILVFGDSNDRELINHVCKLAGRNTTKFITTIDGDRETCEKKKAEWPYKGINNCNTCTLPHLRMTREAIWGVAAEGPYYENRKGPAKQRVHEALILWEKEYGRPPDMIVVASSLWDIARWSYNKPNWTEPKHLPDEAVDAWIKDAGDLMAFIREKTEDYAPLLAFRTTAFPRPLEGDADMRSEQTDLGTRAHLAQLNAAARHLAGKHRFEVVDVERMTTMLTMQDYLMDGHHTADMINWETANIYLNLLRAHRCRMCSRPRLSKKLQSVHSVECECHAGLQKHRLHNSHRHLLRA